MLGDFHRNVDEDLDEGEGNVAGGAGGRGVQFAGELTVGSVRRDERG